MERMSFFEQISRQIISMQIGEVFIISDFSDLADNATIRKVLSRLEEDKKIRRIMWGIYYKSGYNDFPEKYIEPHPDKVARAIARNFGWTIIPCGDTALNMLRISTQLPVIWLYVSNGT